MKQTAIQQAIVMVRNRIDSQIDTLMGKHTIHHLQQIERGLYDLIDVEKEQIIDAYDTGVWDVGCRNSDSKRYYNETYEKK
jgi:hypothetical protein